jgi:hypothetical protein
MLIDAARNALEQPSWSIDEGPAGSVANVCFSHRILNPAASGPLQHTSLKKTHPSEWDG